MVSVGDSRILAEYMLDRFTKEINQIVTDVEKDRRIEDIEEEMLL